MMVGKVEVDFVVVTHNMMGLVKIMAVDHNMMIVHKVIVVRKV